MYSAFPQEVRNSLAEAKILTGPERDQNSSEALVLGAPVAQSQALKLACVPSIVLLARS